MKKGVFMFLVLIITMSRASDFLFEENLEEFLAHMSSDEEEKSEFRGYYSKFLRKQSKLHPERKKGKLQSLRISALNSIEIKNPSLYTEIEPYIIDLDFAQESQSIRLYLTRYALFEEFRRRKVVKRSGIWERTKDGVRRFANRVTEAFKGHKKAHITT